MLFSSFSALFVSTSPSRPANQGVPGDQRYRRCEMCPWYGRYEMSPRYSSPRYSSPIPRYRRYEKSPRYRT